MAYPSQKLRIEGNADERGSAEYNLGLGDRRATAAKDFLVGLPGLVSCKHIVAQKSQRFDDRTGKILIGVEPGQTQALSFSRICRSISSR